MRPKLNLICSSALRGFQMLFALVVLGLSATLVAKHNDGVREYSKKEAQFSGVPSTLILATAIGVLSLMAAIFNLIIAWTDLLREHIEILVDLVAMVANVVCGTIISLQLRGKDCKDTSLLNRIGVQQSYPYTGSLAAVSILNGGCYVLESGASGCVNVATDRQDQLNLRCKQSGTDSVFMFMTVAILLATATLTFLRMKKNV